MMMMMRMMKLTMRMDKAMMINTLLSLTNVSPKKYLPLRKLCLTTSQFLREEQTVEWFFHIQPDQPLQQGSHWECLH